MQKVNKLWVTWEDHRRSRELAKALDYIYIPLTHNGGRLRRYPILALRTIRLIRDQKPKVVICQNPSIVLTFLLCCLKYIQGFKLVVDRHTNFKFKTMKSLNPEWILFHFLSKLTVKVADLTIVTNEPLKKIVEKWGGTGIVLQDKLPQLDRGKESKLEGDINIGFVCTYSNDEPYEKIISLFSSLPSNTHLYVTGNYHKWTDFSAGLIKLPNNVHLMGFVDEEEYQSLIKSVDIVMVITDLEYVLNCGAYEAISVGKPLILSDTLTIRSYFNRGVIHTKLDKVSLKASIMKAVAEKDDLASEALQSKPSMIKEWEQNKTLLESVIDSL